MLALPLVHMGVPLFSAFKQGCNLAPKFKHFSHKKTESQMEINLVCQCYLDVFKFSIP